MFRPPLVHGPDKVTVHPPPLPGQSETKFVFAPWTSPDVRLSWVEGAQLPSLAHGLTQKMTENARKIRLNSCLLISHRTERFFIGIIIFLAPKNICIDINIVTLTALKLKLWHKT